MTTKRTLVNILMIIILIVSTLGNVSYGDSTNIDKLITSAQVELNKPYVWGATGPKSYDCSGYTQAMYKSIGVNISRVSQDQSTNGIHVDRDELQKGDLVFFKTTSAKIGHVGIYIGDNRFIHASSGAKKVVITSLDTEFYSTRYVTARRVIDSTGVVEDSGGDRSGEYEFEREEFQGVYDESTGTGLYEEQTELDIVINYRVYRTVKGILKVINWVIHILSYLIIIAVGLLWALYAVAAAGSLICADILQKATRIDAFESDAIQSMLKVSFVSILIIAVVMSGVAINTLERLIVSLLKIGL